VRQQYLGYTATLSLCRIQAYHACWQELSESKCTDGAAFNESRTSQGCVTPLHSTNCRNKGACRHTVCIQFIVKNLWTRQDCAVGRRRQFGFSIAANSSHPAFPLVSNTCTALAHLSSASQKSRADSTSSWNVFSNSLHIRAWVKRTTGTDDSNQWAIYMTCYV